MFDNMQTGGMEEMNEDELSLAMGAAPSKKAAKKSPAPEEATPSGKKGLKAGKDASESPKKKSISNASQSVLSTAFTTSADEEEEEGPQGLETEEEEEEEIAKPKAKKPKTKTEVLDTEEEEEEETPITEEEEEDEDAAEQQEEKEEEAEEGDITVNGFLKARVGLLIEKGEWLPWEGMKDDEDWTEDSFAEMEINQRQFQRNKMREDILTSFGPYGRKISEFSEGGGDPDELISIFQEEQRAQALSVDTEEQQKDVVLKYETEFLNKKSGNVKRYIDSLDAAALAEEAKDAKTKMEQYWKVEGDELVASQQKAVTAQKEALVKSRATFTTAVTKVVTEDKSIPEEEKKNIIRMLTKFDKKLPNGETVNEFYHKFAEFRKSMPDYINLVRFVSDPKKFMKSIKTEGKNEGVEKSFSLIRGSNKIKKTRSNGTTTAGKGNKSGFKLMY